MTDPQPLHIVYVKAVVQQGLHLVVHPTLILVVKGYAHLRLLGPDGKAYFVYDGHEPALLLAVPGMRIDFATTPARENGFIEFRSEMVQPGKPGTAEIREGDHGIEVPCARLLSAVETSALRDEFERINRLWQMPVPRNMFQIKVGITGILCHFLERGTTDPAEALSPAQRLRRRIDEDRTCSANLGDLSRQCGYSSDHLRKLFQERYHIAPQEYRHRRNMSRAMDLMMTSGATLQGIAAQTGFRHFTYFCTSFKKEFGTTPAKVLKRFQQRKG